jgi:hypothetical protein
MEIKDQKKRSGAVDRDEKIFAVLSDHPHMCKTDGLGSYKMWRNGDPVQRARSGHKETNVRMLDCVLKVH